MSRTLKKYYFGVLVSAVVLCAYPLFMFGKVMSYMFCCGAVPKYAYPKYVIPYVPIAFAVLFGIAVMPLAFRLLKKAAFAVSSVLSVAVFLVSERIMETGILVKAQESYALEGWQMSMCYVPPEGFRTRPWKAVDVLLGGYSPAFKIHFNLISIIIILTLLNSVYGFGSMVKSGDKSRKKALVMQTVCAAAFLGMCIWACFTAFYRDGELQVSTLSAVLMSVFFVLFGVNAGVFTGSFTLGKKKALSVLLPCAVASVVTVVMYIGEMVLLNGNLYTFGSGLFFSPLPLVVLAPVDVLIVLLSGVVTGIIMKIVSVKE